MRDIGLVTGWSAAELASNTIAGVADTTGQVKDVVADKTMGVLDTAMDMGKRGANYVGEMAVGGKDITLEAGIRTAEYAGKAAGVLKDADLDVGWNITKFAGDTAVGKAETVGNVSREVGKARWNAIEYVGDKAMGATEMMGNMTRGAAGLVGDTAVATKDVLSSVGTKTGEMIASAEERAARNLAEKVGGMKERKTSIISDVPIRFEPTKNSNCKFNDLKINMLEIRINILEARLELERHPEDHTFHSGAILYELLDDIKNLLGNEFVVFVICARKLMQRDMEKAKEQLINIMYSLKQIYPPAFFDVMSHLVMHLPEEAILCGPVYMRWMYPFERYMKKLKNYVRYKAKPEGSIAEGYVAEEALTFCSYYLKGVETRFNRPDRNGFGLNPADTFQVFQSVCELVGNFQTITWKQNFPAGLISRSVKRAWKMTRCSPESELFSLACGPESNANSYTACVVNGVKFLLEEILELTYIGNRKVVLFRCKWFDTWNPPFSRSDRSKRCYIKQGINHILTDKDYYRDQQYILATHARQVFYLEDPARRPPHWKVVEDVHHRKIWHRDVVEDDQDVIHDSKSSDVALSANLVDLDYTSLSTNDESTKVDASPDNEAPDEESADFIGDEDDVVPHVLEDDVVPHVLEDDDDQNDDVCDDDDPASVHVVSSDDSSEDEN
nr:hypothetical protein [Tanacetum cinerariifolium]